MFDNIKKYSQAINRIILFAISIIVVIHLFPNKRKFRYEYTLGKPWTHETLIAPFDFPIYKTQSELRAERESISKDFKPYFNYDSDRIDDEVEKFDSHINNRESVYMSSFPFLVNPDNKNQGKPLYSEIEKIIVKQLNEIYRKGLISLPDELSSLSPSAIIMLVKNNFAEPYEIREYYNYQSAYQLLSTKILEFIEGYHIVSQDQADSFISLLELNRYLESNIVYDKERSETEQQDLLRNISLTSGVVLSGQRIIQAGEIIDENSIKILDSFKRESEELLGQGVSHYFFVLGQGIVIVSLFIMIFLFLYFFRKDVYNKLLSVLFLLLMSVAMIFMARLSHVTSSFSIYIIPFAILPIIVRIFFDSRLAFFLHVTTILISAFFADNSFEFVIIQIPAGLTAMFSLYRMVRRSQLVRAAALVILTYSFFYTGLSLWKEGDFRQINYTMYLLFFTNGGLLLLIYPLIYIFEKLFGFLSDVTLVELSDTNHPVLRRLAEKAPGTFQHSIQVANLAQEAIYQIGGNPLLVRAGAMYHDIGKLDSPYFFTENQAAGFNPHSDLPYEQSAQIIIHHIENGVKIAQKEKLPKQLIDFIRTHQGTMKTKFFYNSYINQNPDEEVDVSLFTYPGPTPFSKEMAVLMMADSVEAASRSLKNFNDDEIDRLVEGVINDQIADNQFIDAPITFKEISIAKDIFKQKLKNIYHARVEYPKLKAKKVKS